MIFSIFVKYVQIRKLALDNIAVILYKSALHTILLQNAFKCANACTVNSCHGNIIFSGLLIDAVHHFMGTGICENHH